MLSILSAYIAMSIADRPGLAVGFAGGVLAMNGTNFAGLAQGDVTGISGGFLAALLAGFVSGYIVEGLKHITEKLPASLNGIRPMLIYPLGGLLAIGAVMCGINPVMGMINTAMTDWLNAMGGTSKVLLGAIVAGMMAVDMGLCFVSEGAIPYAAADPLRVLPSCVIGAALSGALSMTFGCALRAPHGGIFVFPVVDHALLYLVALAIGSIVSAVILSLLKKDRTEA